MKAAMNKKFTIKMLTVICLLVPNVLAASDIAFYGRVVDNENVPIAGALVNARIQAANKSETISVSTDANGRFSMTGSGESLQILNIYKKGYVFYKDGKKQHVFQYNATDNVSAFKPDPQNPQAYRLDKPGKPQKIQTFRTFHFKPHKKSVYTIDLTSDTSPQIKKTKIPEVVLQIPEVREMMKKNSRKDNFTKPKRKLKGSDPF